jgi:hypothetical protein
MDYTKLHVYLNDKIMKYVLAASESGGWVDVEMTDVNGKRIIDMAKTGRVVVERKYGKVEIKDHNNKSVREEKPDCSCPNPPRIMNHECPYHSMEKSWR